MNLPPDFDDLEIELYKILVEGPFEPTSSSYIYEHITDPMNKFIACFVFEAGKTQKEAEIATGLSKATIWKRIGEIRKQIGESLGENKLID